MIVAIFANSFRAETMREVKHLIDYLQAKEIEIVLSHELHQEPFGREYASIDDYNQDSEQIDFAISIGGDGTFLTTASLVGHLDIPIHGINCGHLGCLAEAQTANAEQVLD